MCHTCCLLLHLFWYKGQGWYSCLTLYFCQFTCFHLWESLVWGPFVESPETFRTHFGLHNRPFSNSHGWAGSSMKRRLMRANLFKCKLICISLHFMLDPVQPLEYETGLFSLYLQNKGARNFVVILIFIPLTTHEKHNLLLR